MYDLIDWLLDECLDEYNWESIKDDFPMLLCEQLEELGYLKVVDDYYCPAWLLS